MFSLLKSFSGTAKFSAFSAISTVHLAIFSSSPSIEIKKLSSASSFIFLALHSQGEVIYWSYGKKHPLRSRKMAEIMATSSGYALDYPVPIATGGGFKDWFIAAFHRCGFTVEMGLGKNPLPLSDFEAEYPRVKNLLNIFAGLC